MDCPVPRLRPPGTKGEVQIRGKAVYCTEPLGLLLVSLPGVLVFCSIPLPHPTSVLWVPGQK